MDRQTHKNPDTNDHTTSLCSAKSAKSIIGGAFEHNLLRRTRAGAASEINSARGNYSRKYGKLHKSAYNYNYYIRYVTFYISL